MTKVKNHTLLLIACMVWLIAGYNILHIGILSYQGYITLFNITVSAFVFCFFWFMIFKKLVKKHIIRINAFGKEKQFFLKFFDTKSFVIMALMMTLGITVRNLQLMPAFCIAVFYTGLGIALFSAGILFGVHFIKFKTAKNRKTVCPR